MPVVPRRVRARLTEVELDGEAGVYHPGTDRVVMLNGTATAVWRLVDGRRDVAEIGRVLAERYEVPEPTAAEGARLALEQLVAEELVVADDGGIAPS